MLTDDKFDAFVDHRVPQTDEIHRLENGAIDLDFYENHCRRVRSAAFHQAGRLTADWLRRLIRRVARRRPGRAISAEIGYAAAE